MTELFASLAETAPAYRVLARKYRPSTFGELIGQEAMVRTIANAIKAGRLPHAWILTGVRGVGKTTTARIIAKALNCTGPESGGKPVVDPCNKCESCLSISEDRHVDVQEMDAASRTGVDDIRDIIEGVRYGPVSGRYKVYILDEVHMLSKNAFNALLKTLEEPPPHVKFIFATTEIRKVPVTVLSRCQRFDLRRIDSSKLMEHFSSIVEKEGGRAETEAIKLIARAADGSVRDGLSLLDQAMARGGGKVRETDVKEMLGLADRAQSIALCRYLLLGEMPRALEAYDLMLKAGDDPVQILQDLSELVHGLTRAQIVPGYAGSPDLPEEDRLLFNDLKRLGIPALTRAWQILLKGIGETVSAPDPARAAEMALIRLAYAANLPPPAELVKQLQEGMGTASAPMNPSPKTSFPGSGKSKGSAALAITAEPRAADPVAVVKTITAMQPMPATFRDLVTMFAANREGNLCAQLENFAHLVRYEPGLLELRLENGAPPDFLNKLNRCLNKWTGKRWKISLVDKPGLPTIAEEKRKAEEEKKARAMTHPLTQAVMATFPKARIKSIYPKKTTADLLSEEKEDFLPDPEEQGEEE